MGGVVEPQAYVRRWYFTKEEIENCSPSRKDGIDLKSESHLRKLYCTFMHDIGIKLKVPQLTISCAMLLCHQFYMRQSHAKNDWQTVASACIFLACKVEETPRFLNDSVVVAYEMVNQWDPSAPKRIRQKELFDKQKKLILTAERLVLSTIAFDLNIQFPYKLLVTALKRLGILPHLARVAWNFINDWYHTTICIQYKPQYIAAGSLYLAAKFQKVKLPTKNGRVWWMEFDITLKQLEEVIGEMRKLLGHDEKPATTPSANQKTERYPQQSSSQSCVSSITVQKDSSDIKTPTEHESRKIVENRSSSSGASTSSVVEDPQPSPVVDSDRKPELEIASKIDVTRIREALKKRKRAKIEKSSLESSDVEGSEAWIERQLENGIEIDHASLEKKQRNVLIS